MKWLISFYCAILTYGLTGQNTWAQSLPFSFIQATFCGLYQDEQAYYFHTNQHVVQFDHQGTISGYLQFPNLADIHTGVIKKINPATGLPYFITLRRNSTPSATYTIRAFQPGTGFVHEQSFPDSLGLFTGERPALSEMPDGDFLVTGRQFYRKIRYSPDAGFEEIWTKPLNRETVSVHITDDRILIGDRNGSVLALDLNGSFLWSQDYGFLLRDLSVAPGGLVLSGATTGNKSLIIRTDDNGTELWRKETEDRDYYDVISTVGGGFAAAGTTNSNEVVLATFDDAGAPVWRDTYMTGIGLRVLQDPDGGFILLAYGTDGPVNGAQLVKTNNLGQNAPLKKAVIEGRRLQNKSVETILRPRSTLFADESDPTVLYASDTATLAHAISPWIGALDGEEKLHLAADLNPLSTSDFQTGPIGSEPKDFKRVWAVSHSDIQRLRLDFGQDQTIDGRIPFDILTWPAKENPYFQLNLDFTPVNTQPDLFPAPFVDADGDGIYNVYKGDYPLIKGDQTAWWIMNDLAYHAESQGLPLEIQMAFSVYTQNCPENGTIDQSLFVELEAVNLSSRNYTNAYWGLYSNFDLGCNEDDYLGTIPDADACFAYNYATEDTDCGLGPDYLNKAPLQSLTYLNRAMSGSMAVFNSSIGQPPIECTNPIFSNEFYRYLTAQWRDGAPLSPGGWGYHPNPTDTVRFIFPGNPADAADWSMCTADLGTVDVRSLSAAGPFQLAAGDTTRLQFVLTFHKGINNSQCPDLHQSVKPTLLQLKSWHANGALDERPNLPTVVLLNQGESVTLNAGISIGAQSYQWSNGANTAGITVSQPGVYAVTVTAATGCKLEDEVLVQLSTSTTDKEQLPDWTIRPNPASDHAWIECRECPAGYGVTRVVVRNAQGVALRQLEAAGPALRVDTSNLPTGLYWLELWQDGRYLGAQKWIIVK